MAMTFWHHHGLSTPFSKVKRLKHFLLQIWLQKWTEIQRKERTEKREWNGTRKRCGITWLYCEEYEVCSTSSVLTKHVRKGIPRSWGEHYFEAFHFTKMEGVWKLMVIACQEWEAWLKFCPLLLTWRNWGTFWDRKRFRKLFHPPETNSRSFYYTHSRNAH